MKRSITLLICALMALSLVGCGGTTSEPEAPPTPPDLTGEWKQVNNSSDESYQTATIQGDTIEIYWVSETDDSKSLYWAGSFVAPTTADEPYTWDSINDTDKTSTALLASGDETKTMTHQDGQLSYSASALGTYSDFLAYFFPAALTALRAIIAA